MVKSFRATAILMFALAIIATGAVMLISRFLVLFPSESDSIASISYLISVPRLSSVELNSSHQNWIPYKNERISETNCYGYAKIVIDNTNDNDFVGYIYNHDTNICTELLECGILEATTIARLGDRFPDTTGNGFNKATFKITVPSNTKKTYILEYENQASIEIHPLVLNEHDFFKHFYRERALYYIIITLIICFIVYLIVISLVFHDWTPFAMSIFTLSELFFYLRQSRMLLAMFSMPIPTWLASFQIVLNMTAAMFLIIHVRDKMTPPQQEHPACRRRSQFYPRPYRHHNGHRHVHMDKPYHDYIRPIHCLRADSRNRRERRKDHTRNVLHFSLVRVHAARHNNKHSRVEVFDSH